MILIFRRWDNHQPWWLQYMYSSLYTNKWLFGSHTTIYLHNDLIIMCRVVLYSVYIRRLNSPPLSMCLPPKYTITSKITGWFFKSVLWSPNTVHTNQFSTDWTQPSPPAPPPFPHTAGRGRVAWTAWKQSQPSYSPRWAPADHGWAIRPLPACLPAAARNQLTPAGLAGG